MLLTIFVTLLWLVSITLAFFIGARLATKQIADAFVAHRKSLEKYKGSQTPIGDRLADELDFEF